MKAKRRLNDTPKVSTRTNQQTDTQTETQTDISTHRETLNLLTYADNITIAIKREKNLMGGSIFFVIFIFIFLGGVQLLAGHAKAFQFLSVGLSVVWSVFWLV